MGKRKSVDLRNLPVWLQITISTALVVIVSTVAWLIGQDKPIPAWIKQYLVPFLGLFVLGLFALTFVAQAIKSLNKSG